MSNEIRLKAAAGKSNVQALIVAADGTVWSGAAMVALSSLDLTAWRAALIACTELATSTPEGMGVYVADWPGALSQAAVYSVLFWEGATPSPSDTVIGQQDDPCEYLAAQVADIYHAEIELTIDDANDQDEYTARWFKNGLRVTSGITTPLIQVVNRADGTDLVAATAMTEVGSTGGLKYDEATNRVTAGEAVEVTVTATIDGATRTWADVVSRDSA